MKIQGLVLKVMQNKAEHSFTPEITSIRWISRSEGVLCGGHRTPKYSLSLYVEVIASDAMELI